MSAGGDGLSPIPILHLETDAAPAPRSASRHGKPTAPMIGRHQRRQAAGHADAAGRRQLYRHVGARRETVRIHQQDQTIFVHDRRRHPYADRNSLPHLYQRGGGDQRRTARADDGHDPEGQRRGRRQDQGRRRRRGPGIDEDGAADQQAKSMASSPPSTAGPAKPSSATPSWLSSSRTASHNSISNAGSAGPWI